MVNHGMFAHYPLLLGGDHRLTQSCPSNAPRIFVYDTGDIADRPISCARSGFWASEVYVDRFLRYSACREHDWRRADLFFVPAYLTCWELKRASKLSGRARTSEAEALTARLRDLPHWSKRGGFDHLFSLAPLHGSCLVGGNCLPLPSSWLWSRSQSSAQRATVSVGIVQIASSLGRTWSFHL